MKGTEAMMWVLLVTLVVLALINNESSKNAFFSMLPIFSFTFGYNVRDSFERFKRENLEE